MAFLASIIFGCATGLLLWVLKLNRGGRRLHRATRENVIQTRDNLVKTGENLSETRRLLVSTGNLIDAALELDAAMQPGQAPGALAKAIQKVRRALGPAVEAAGKGPVH